MKMSFSWKLRQLGRTLMSPLVLAAAMSLVAAPVLVYAVHDADVFELDTRPGVEGDQDKKNDPPPLFVGDGNTKDDAQDGEDWENVYLENDSSFARSFVEDTFANNPIDAAGVEVFVPLRTPEVSFFTGGGSKDTNGIQDGPWKYKVVKDQVPDKNDIVNAFAAAYEDPSDGHTLLYFGLDTFSVNGDSNAGFWFFRQPVGLNPPVDDTGTFSGEHSNGDIFVAVAYTQGGRVGDIDVYEWQGDDATGSLVLMFSGLDCAEVGPADGVCGVINKLLPGETFGEDPIFDYANTLVANNPTDPTSYMYESAAFVEFGLDYDEVFGRPIGCFTTFLAETRSSQSETAQLKDFAFGNFPLCSIAVDKTGDLLSKVGDPVSYTITVENTGRATLYKQSITDTVLGDLTDGTNAYIDSSDCGDSLASKETCTIELTRTVQASDPDPLPNTVTVVYTEFADPASLEFTAEDDHEVNLFQPSYVLAKYCPEGVDASNPWIVGVEKEFRFSIDNTSSDDSPNLFLQTLTDALLGDAVVKAAAVAAGAGELAWDDATVTFTVPYTPTAADAATGYVVNSFATMYQPDGFPNELEQDASTDQCPVIKRDADILTEVHADLLEDNPDAGPHVDVTFGQVPSTTPIHDHAYVSDATAAASGGSIAPITPTGDLTIRLFADGACLQNEIIGAGPDGHVYPLTLSLAGGEAETNTFALPVGTLGWLVSYDGDGVFNSVSHACEPITGLQRDTQTVTYIHEGQPNASHSSDPVSIDIQNTSVQVGTVVHDSALVSQLNPIDSLVPTGSVDFLFFESHAACESAVQVIASSENAALVNGYAESSAHEITDIGSGELAYQAVYVPADENFNSSTSACELLDIELNPSAITTEVHDDLHNIVSYDTNGGIEIPVGTVIHDWAEVTGLGLAPYDPTGTVTFELYMGLACEGEPVKTVSAALRADATNDAKAIAETLDAEPPLSIVTISGDEFSFMASYGGDGVYAASSDSRCEPVKVQKALEGCTPGYWKQTHHFGNWLVYNPYQYYDEVFGAGPHITLLEALESGGNTNSEALLRHSVAALLNSVGDVDYAYTEAQILQWVEDAWNGSEDDRQALHYKLAEANERDCPLSRAEYLF
ncbi:hypothetical protein GCM10009104_18060 [Marinobacterium maritimum]|uniref:DUF7507 domain-containing protein n=1 Tax=Marinobacterium maritimum TaxID=500162 RepID=A0ABN1I642_9GAMM